MWLQIAWVEFGGDDVLAEHSRLRSRLLEPKNQGDNAMQLQQREVAAGKAGSSNARIIRSPSRSGLRSPSADPRTGHFPGFIVGNYKFLGNYINT